MSGIAVSPRAAILVAFVLAGCRRAPPNADPVPRPGESAGAAKASSTPVSAAPSAAPAAAPSQRNPAAQVGPNTNAQMPSYRISVLGTRRCPQRPYERFAPGRSRFGVELAIEATGERTIVADAYYARLHDAEGRQYAPTFGGCEPDLRHTRLAPGARARGWVSFEWSDKATPAKLVYSPDLSGAGRIEPSTLSLR